ncbi:MFS transporter [Croceicoccus naphthovorans]|uniref:Major facilitator transporter n=1 Tax=Croceicoccus naphthovorans TaxID=1348774 RepID=A0A0G3XLS8_9SPHN|nr:MFS transporter [Croceicoccus naphthovorans]AKM11579.1 major facilitator transporter [Croceicoccus naphthovorans]
MLTAIYPVRSLLLAIFLLMLGNGFVATLLSIRLESANASAPVIGVMAAAYFAGLMLGSLRISPVIARVGHIRAFAAVVSLLSASTLAYSLYMHPAFWMVLRLIDGLCVAGVFVCLESWLNQRAESLTRGTILAAYMIALYSGQAAGQFLLNMGGSLMLPFVISSILVTLSAIPVLLTRIEGPQTGTPETLSLRLLYSASPLGMVGVGTTGLILGAFYGLGPVYASRLGLDLKGVSVFMSCVIAGGVVLQGPLGHLSDRFDRRRVIVFVLMCGLAASLALGALGGTALLPVFGALFGGLAFALYPLCVAHTNDRLTSDQRLSASGGLILVYSIGAVAGPLGGAVAMSAFGAAGLFWFVGGALALALVFAVWRQARTEAVDDALQQPFQPLPRTTTMTAPLEPASDEV